MTTEMMESGFPGGGNLKGELSDELMNDMRQSVLMQGNDDEEGEKRDPAHQVV